MPWGHSVGRVPAERRVSLQLQSRFLHISCSCRPSTHSDQSLRPYISSLYPSLWKWKGIPVLGPPSANCCATNMLGSAPITAQCVCQCNMPNSAKVAATSSGSGWEDQTTVKRREGGGGGTPSFSRARESQARHPTKRDRFRAELRCWSRCMGLVWLRAAL